MVMLRAVLTALLTALALTTPPAVAAPDAFAPDRQRVVPLEQAHAHNDYEHARPLSDALDHGFTSVEADIWPVDGALLVGHDREDLRPDRGPRCRCTSTRLPGACGPPPGVFAARDT